MQKTFYKQRGNYFEVSRPCQSICCTAAFCMTIEYKYNQVCNSKYVLQNTDTCQISPYLRKCDLTVGYNKIQKTQFTKAAAMVVSKAFSQIKWSQSFFKKLIK